MRIFSPEELPTCHPYGPVSVSSVRGHHRIAMKLRKWADRMAMEQCDTEAIAKVRQVAVDIDVDNWCASCSTDLEPNNPWIYCPKCWPMHVVKERRRATVEREAAYQQWVKDNP